MSDLYKTTLPIPAGLLDILQPLLTERAIPNDVGEGAHEDEFILTLFAPEAEQGVLEAAVTLAFQAYTQTDSLAHHRAHAGSAPVLVWQRIPPENWQAKALADFPPIVLGDFVITRNDEPVPVGQTRLAIPAAMAFGSGEHATTAGCLALYQTLHTPPKTVLDMGCGSGILAIAAAKRDGAHTLCVDIDPDSITICAENAAMNGVAAWVQAVVGDGFATPDVAAHAPYDLIFANILMDPLIAMAPALVPLLAPHGQVILSGYMLAQAEAVHAAYQALGLQVQQEVIHTPWVATRLSRGNSTHA